MSRVGQQLSPGSPNARSPRRRARNSLSVEEIVTSAIELVERDGLPALTIRAVANDLGTAPMSVYNYLADRADLELAMLEHVTAELPFEASGSDPRERLLTRLTGLHDHLARHRWALLILISGDLVPTNSFALADACIGDLLELGLTPADAIYAYGVCWHLTLGELLDRHPGEPRIVDGVTQRERALRTLTPERFPNYANVLAVLDPSDAPPPCQFPRTIRVVLPALLDLAR
jgi:AcrR family transcriptional regulator